MHTLWSAHTHWINGRYLFFVSGFQLYTEIHSQKKTLSIVCFLSRICTMKTRLGCLSNKSDSYSDFSEFLPPAHETTARCLKWVCQKNPVSSSVGLQIFNNLKSSFCCVRKLSRQHIWPSKFQHVMKLISKSSNFWKKMISFITFISFYYFTVILHSCQNCLMRCHN